MSLTIEITTEDIAEWLYDVISMKDAVTTQAKDWITWFLMDTMEEEAPVGLSGRLGESITSVVTDDTISVFPDIWYAIFVEEGAAASEGTYVSGVKPFRSQSPYIGGRIKKGIHKGTPANPFVARTYMRLMDEMDDFLDRYIEHLIYPHGRKIYG